MTDILVLADSFNPWNRTNGDGRFRVFAFWQYGLTMKRNGVRTDNGYFSSTHVFHHPVTYSLEIRR